MRSCLLANINKGTFDNYFSPKSAYNYFPASATLLVSAESITYTKASVLAK